jgi:UDP-N-acetyl-D-glucosamine dehydrogenase
MNASGYSDLLDRFERKTAKVGIIGLGYVGLPLALACAKCGFTTIGFDVDKAKIATLGQGQSYLKHISGEKIKKAVDSGALGVSGDFTQLMNMDAILICVPTPLAAENKPNLSYVTSTADVIAKNLQVGQLIVLESTTYPGTTEEVLRPILEAGGLKSREDFYLAYSPEREDPGNPKYETSIVPKVVGGDGVEALKLAEAMYNQIFVETVPVSSLDTAEAVKLTENIFRSVNIALVNELKLIYDKMGINVWEVIEAAKTKPFGYMPFYPGPGLGGHCIPIDPFYLTWRAEQFGQKTRFIELAGEINTAMPGHVVQVLEDALKERFDKNMAGAKVLVLGVAYKKNIDDVRESPAFTIIELLEGKGASTAFYDPHVVEIPPTREHMQLAGRRSINWDPSCLADYDAVLIVTDHDGVDYGALVKESLMVVDTRNSTSTIADPEGKTLRA